MRFRLIAVTLALRWARQAARLPKRRLGRPRACSACSMLKSRASPVRQASGSSTSRPAKKRVRGDEAFNSASVIKIPVLVLAFQMADKGSLSLADRITITATDVRGGSGIFRYNDPGLQPTLRDVLLQMIITSDNTATDLAIGQGRRRRAR